MITWIFIVLITIYFIIKGSLMLGKSWFRIKRTFTVDTGFRLYSWTHASVIGEYLEITRNPTSRNGRLCEKIKLPKNKHGWKVKSMIGDKIVLESDFRYMSAKSNFPAFITKSNEERCQNLVERDRYMKF